MYTYKLRASNTRTNQMQSQLGPHATRPQTTSSRNNIIPQVNDHFVSHNVCRALFWLKAVGTFLLYSWKHPCFSLVMVGTFRSNPYAIPHGQPQAATTVGKGYTRPFCTPTGFRQTSVDTTAPLIPSVPTDMVPMASDCTGTCYVCSMHRPVKMLHAKSVCQMCFKIQLVANILPDTAPYMTDELWQHAHHAVTDLLRIVTIAMRSPRVDGGPDARDLNFGSV